MWTKQPIDEIVRLIEWINYPPNTSKIEFLEITKDFLFLVLASEGFRCPFIAYLKTGECHILRKVDVVKTAQNGAKVIKSIFMKIQY
jgi:hypothetical protein